MEYKPKSTFSQHKQIPNALKLTTLQNQYSKIPNKNKSVSNILLKQQMMKDNQSSKHSNLYNSSIQDLNTTSKHRQQQIDKYKNEDNQYSRLLNKVSRNRSKYEREPGMQNSKFCLNTTLKINHTSNEHNNETLNTSFKSNESRLKFMKKDESKSRLQPNTLSKCLSMNFLQTLQSKNKKTPPNREPSEDCLKLRPAIGPKMQSELVKVLNQLKTKNSLIKQLEQRQQDYIRQLSSKNKTEMEYYKLLNKNIILEQQLRTQQRRSEELQNQLQLLVNKINYIESVNYENQNKFRDIEKTLTKQHEQSIEEWRQLNENLSDSLIKLNQENSLIARKLSEAELKPMNLNNKLIESEKLVDMLRSDLEFEKNAHNSLVSIHNTKLDQLKIKNSQLVQLYKEQTEKSQFYQKQSLSLVQQIEQFQQSLTNKQQQILFYKTTVIGLQAQLCQIQNRPQHQFTTQQQQLRQTLILLKISYQQKQQKFQGTINEYQNKISILQDQIDQIKSVTSQSYNILELNNQDDSELDDQKRQNLELQTSIVELKSRLEVFMIIEKQLRQRLEMSGERMKQVVRGWKEKVDEKESMILIIKDRNNLLEKQLQIVSAIKGNYQPSSVTDSKVQQFIKEQIVKIRNLQDIVTRIHSENKKLQYQLADKTQFIDELKKQIDKDDETIKDFRGILEEMNKRLISHSQLLEITNKAAIVEQLRFGNYREEIGEQIKTLKEENGNLEGELKGIYNKLEILEEKIEEQDQESQYCQSRAQECQNVIGERQIYIQEFIEQKRQRLSHYSFQI